MTYDQRDTDRWDVVEDWYDGTTTMSSYDMGFDDAAVNQVDPMEPENEEYMQGYRDGKGELAPMPDEGIRRRGW